MIESEQHKKQHKTLPAKIVKAQLSVGETILAKLAIDNVLPDGAEVVIDGIESQRTNICKIIRELKI